jgi:lactoylglutathione lyase
LAQARQPWQIGLFTAMTMIFVPLLQPTNPMIYDSLAGPLGPESVAILNHPTGLELNLIMNAPSACAPKVLRDLAEKHPGITHVVLLCPDIIAKTRLEAAGIPLSGGPVRFSAAAQAIFVRDPDRNVIELHQRR